MTITVYADELLRLIVDDIGDEEFFEIKDRENETEEHLAHLRKLCYERAEKDQSRPVDGGELGARLGRLPSRDSSIPRSSRYRSPSTSTIDSEKDREGGWKEEEEAYRALVAEGGRPSHPVTLGYDVVDNPDRYKPYKDILWFWHFRGAGYYQEFRYQLIEWREFRAMQDKRRSYYVPRNRFQEYQDSVRKSQTDAGWNHDLRVLKDRHQQNRLEDWNEFRASYYRRLKACAKRVPPAEEDLSMYQRKFEDAQARLTDVITDPQVLYGRFDDIRASEKEVMEAKSREESAEKALQAAKQNRSKGKAALMRIAHQEVASARDNLKKVSGSEELRRLRDGYELHITRRCMVRSKAELNGAERDVQRWKVFLKWIDDQYPVIAGECGLFASGASHVSFQPAKGIEDPRSQKERPQARQRRRKNPWSVLSPNISSKISKSSKFSKRSDLSQLPSDDHNPIGRRATGRWPLRVVVAPAQQGNSDHSRESRPSPCLTKSTLQPTRSSARIAERKRYLQDSNAPSETVRTVSKDVHELSKVKPRKEKSLKRATTKSGERLKRRHPSKPQGVTKRKGPSSLKIGKEGDIVSD